MTLLIERELAALADHQYIAELRCADGRCRASAFANLLILIHRWAVPQNRAEREQPRIVIEHYATIDLRDAFKHSRR